MSRVSRVFATVAIAAAAAGCGRDGGLEARADSARVQWLAGMWDCRFQLDGGLAPRTTVTTRVVSGRIALLPNRWLGSPYPGLGTPTNFGTYDVDFTPLGFEPRARDETPTVVAAWTSRDSVQLILTTGSPSLSVALRGHAAGDSIVGTWRYTLARASGGEGSFLLRRVRQR